jgi:hypothetical protein
MILTAGVIVDDVMTMMLMIIIIIIIITFIKGGEVANEFLLVIWQ